MIIDICRMIKLAFTPIRRQAPSKYIRKTVIGSNEVLHVQVKNHFAKQKDSFVKNPSNK